MKVETQLQAPKGAATVFSTFPLFWGSRLGILPFFGGLTVIHLRGPKIQAMPRLIPPAA